MKLLFYGLFIGLIFIGCGSDTSTTDERIVEKPLLGDTSIDQLPNLDTSNQEESISKEEIQKRLKSSTVKIILPDIGQGSGFLIGDGYIVTNNHIATLSSNPKVRINTEDKDLSAQVVSYAECEDLALIRLDFDGNYDHLEWYEDNISEGMSIATAGFPSDVTNSSGESQYTYTEGIINTTASLKNTTWASTKVFYHSAKINGGSSGSPVIELKTGKVVGINYGGTDSRQLSISASYAKNYISKMINGESISSLGISPEVFFSKTGESLGVYIEAVIPDGLASQIGIKKSDVIHSFGEKHLYEDNNMSVQEKEDTLSLKAYCSVLENREPSNRSNVIPIEIIRLASDGKIYYCKGEINGLHLYNIDNGLECPQ